LLYGSLKNEASKDGASYLCCPGLIHLGRVADG